MFCPRMENSEIVLSKLTYEMACYSIVHDVLSLHVTKEDNDTLLLSLLDVDGSDTTLDIEVLLIRKISDLDNECDLMVKVLDIFQTLVSAPDSVLRKAFKNALAIIYNISRLEAVFSLFLVHPSIS